VLAVGEAEHIHKFFGCPPPFERKLKFFPRSFNSKGLADDLGVAGRGGQPVSNQDGASRRHFQPPAGPAWLHERSFTALYKGSAASLPSLPRRRKSSFLTFCSPAFRYLRLRGNDGGHERAEIALYIEGPDVAGLSERPGRRSALGLPQSIFLYNAAFASESLGNPVDKPQPCQASSRQNV